MINYFIFTPATMDFRSNYIYSHFNFNFYHICTTKGVLSRFGCCGTNHCPDQGK